MVEVHLHGIVADLLHHAQHTLALCVGHRNLAAHEENILGQLAVDHEYRFGEVDDRVVDDFAVAVGGSEREGDLLARFLADDGRLEFGQQHTGAEDEFQRLSGTRPVGDFAVDGERVIHRHHFVVFCFHEFIELNIVSKSSARASPSAALFFSTCTAKIVQIIGFPLHRLEKRRNVRPDVPSVQGAMCRREFFEYGSFGLSVRGFRLPADDTVQSERTARCLRADYSVQRQTRLRSP